MDAPEPSIIDCIYTTGSTPDPAAETRPAGTRPAGTRPAGTRPAGTRPAGTRPAAEAVSMPGPRRVPVLLLLITAVHLGLLLSYAFVYPTWTGYDEAQHVDMVYGLQHGVGWPAPGKKIISTGVAATSDDFDRGRFQDMFQAGGKRRGSPSFAEIDPTPRGQRQSFDALGGVAPVGDGRLSNQMVQHPPLIYVVGARLLDALPGSKHWAYDQQVFVLRLLNILVVAPLPLLAWLAARRFGLDQPSALAAATLPLAVPGFTRVGATFNNDGLLMLATGGLTVTLVGVLRGDMRRRTAARAGIWLGIALLTKAFALALPAMIVAAYLVGWWRLRRAGRQAPERSAYPAGRLFASRRAIGSLPWTPATLAVGLGLALGGWWWIRNYVLYDSVQPNGWATNPPRREPLLLPDSFLTWFWYFFRTMISRFWGGLGLFEPPQLSPVAIVVATGAVVGLCAAALAAGPRRAARPDRLASTAGPAVLLLPVAFAYLMVGQRSWAEYQQYTRGIAVQGRYLYLGLVGLGVVFALGLRAALRGRERLAPAVTLVGALLMQGLGLLAVCSYYWLPRQVSFTPARVPEIVAGAGRWAPFPIGVTITVFALSAVLVVLCLAVAVRAGGARGTREAAITGPGSGPGSGSGSGGHRPTPAPRSPSRMRKGHPLRAGLRSPS